MPGEPSLVIRGLRKTFGATTALDGVSLSVRPGEVHGVLGQNGAGKSTLVKIMTGVYPFGSYEGQVLLAGTEARFASPHDARAAHVGYVPQEIEVIDELDVTENVLAGQVAQGLVFRRREARRRCLELMEQLGLSIDIRKRVGSLSAAQRQLVMIARALASHPEVLILDEPTTSLSEGEALRLCRVVKDLSRQGLSIIFITHRVREVMDICDTATILRDGRVAESLGAGDFSQNRIVSGMAGREIQQLYPGRSYSTDEVVMSCEGVSTRPTSANGCAVKGISFDLHRGEILGVAGVLGSGRTELLFALYGLLPRTGSVCVNGADVAAGRPVRARRAGIGLLTEDRKAQGLLFNMPLAQNITLGSLPLISRFGVIRRDVERHVAERVIENFAIKTPSVSAPITHLSGGNQQKLLLGRCLLAGPRIVLLDEPTKGVDVGTRQAIYQKIADLSHQGVGVMVVSSELDELLGLSDRVLVLGAGRLVDQFKRGEGDEERILHAVTLGTRASGGEPMTA